MTTELNAMPKFSTVFPTPHTMKRPGTSATWNIPLYHTDGFLAFTACVDLNSKDHGSPSIDVETEVHAVTAKREVGHTNQAE